MLTLPWRYDLLRKVKEWGRRVLLLLHGDYCSASFILFGSLLRAVLEGL